MSIPSRATTRLHRRIELLVALLTVAGLTVLLASVDPATAATTTSTTSTTSTTTTTREEDTSAPDEQAPELKATTEEEPKKRKRAQTFRIGDARVSPSKVFLGGRKKAAFRFELGGQHARKVLVKVVHVKSGKIRKRIRVGKVQAGERKRVTWNGKMSGKKGWTSQGKHAFRVFAGGQRAKVRRKDSGSQRFKFYKHRFPVRGRHSYGDGFGAGRGHQGQDVFAKCGTPMVAARGGRVQTRAYQSSAGYYVVIDGRGTGRDYVYMHMSKRGRPAQGSWVKTGERIGKVNDTGNASGCHLHFELWTKPGWYQGGRAVPATKPLKRWDRWS